MIKKRRPATPGDYDTPKVVGWNPSAITFARKKERGSVSALAPILLAAYRFKRLRALVQRACLRLEGGHFYSKTWRKILKRFHGVDIGPYSYGPILTPGHLSSGTTVGSYCSVAPGLVVRRRDHPLAQPSLHPFFYNARLGYLSEETIHSDEENPLCIENDVWIGDRVTILGGCRKIGNGAVLAAGAVVTRDVAPYCIVGGVPAKVMRQRLSVEMAQETEKSFWWTKSVEEIVSDSDSDRFLKD